MPLNVGFSAAGSSDPDGDALAYDWDFGDSTPHASGSTTSHSYTAAGIYTATLTVSDGRGGSDSAQLRIDAGNSAPTPSIDAPAASLRYRVGQQITLRGSATDAQDGELDGPHLSWRVPRPRPAHRTRSWRRPAASASRSRRHRPRTCAAAATSYLRGHPDRHRLAGPDQRDHQEIRRTRSMSHLRRQPAGPHGARSTTTSSSGRAP